MKENETLGLILGSGDLANFCLKSLVSNGCRLRIIRLPCSDINVSKDEKSFNLEYENIYQAFIYLKAQSINKVVMIGKVIRPQFNLKKFTSKSLEIIEPLIPYLSKGDNSLFVVIKKIFENQGISVLKLQEILSELTLPEGSYGIDISNKKTDLDIKNGVELFKKYSSLDLGQSLVFNKGHCLGLETMPGTDEMLKGIINFRENGEEIYEQRETGGFLIKAPKLGQILEIDVPTIGPKTISLMNKAKLEGLVIQSNQVLIMEKDKVIDMIKKNRMFLVVEDILLGN